MSTNFLENEAEVSEEEDVNNSSDEEEDPEDECNEDIADLINDDVEEEVTSDSDEEIGRRKRDRRELDDRLEDEDYDLIEENLGVKVARKKFRRLRQISDEEESDEEAGGAEDHHQFTERDAIAREIFQREGDEDEDEIEEDVREVEQLPAGDAIDMSEEESDVDDFIVDDEGRPIATKKKKKKGQKTIKDSALQEAQDIFGLEFDFDEFDTMDDQYDEEEEDEYEVEDDEEVDAEGLTRAKRPGKKRATKKSIYEVFEPSDLERGHFTDLDQEIRTADVPERFKLRGVPVTEAKDMELDIEADWIYRQAFNTPPVSRQDFADGPDSHGHYKSKPRSTIGKIKEALNFIRNEHLEVPFIAFYRKEYVEPELNFNDLYKIFQWDEKWCQLRTRKFNLRKLFERMQTYQFEQIQKAGDDVLPDSFRALSDTDLERLDTIQTIEELKDVYSHFLLYYGRDLTKMHNATKKETRKVIRKVLRKKEKIKDPDDDDDDDDDDEDKDEEDEWEEVEEEVEEEIEDEAGTSYYLKQATRKSMYSTCQNAGLDGLAKKFGLTPEQFGENLRDNYQRNDTDQHPIEPLEAAKDYLSTRFTEEESLLKATRYMVALQLSHDPLVRQTVRETYYERAKICVKPTRKGQKEIDEAHPCFPMKYLKDKQVKDLKGEQFLKLLNAEKEKLLTMTMNIDMKNTSSSRGLQTYFEEIKQLYYRDEYSNVVQAWNKERVAALELALNMLYPVFEKELRIKLLNECKECILRMCSLKMYNYLKVAPYQADQQQDDEDEFLDIPGKVGLRVLGISFSSDMDVPTFGALLDGEGEVSDFVRLPNFLKSTKSYFKRDKELKEVDIEKLKDFLSSKKPHVVGVMAESRRSIGVIRDIQQCISELEAEQQITPINVELIEDNVAMIFQTSNIAESEFRQYPLQLRQAISIARRLQDPLVEFSRLCNVDEEILCLKLHPMQDSLVKETLLQTLYQEFIYRVNEVGVDVNRALEHPHTQSLMQFVCGLGPRKAGAIIKTLKQENQRLENRTQLVTTCNLGPKVFINCAGFIKIDTAKIGESTEAYVEVLDSTRVHPETYDWARKMAVDALEYDESAVDANPADALNEILDNPEKLRDLDLDAFADELERQNYGNKRITLYDIRAELNNRYKDLRSLFQEVTPEERFQMLTKETPATFYIGKLVLGKVIQIARRRPRGEELDNANPVRKDDTGLWQCPFCLQDDFPELSEVWSHFDGGNCPGQAIGVKVRLDNGLMGFIPTKAISDKHVKNPEDRVKVNMTLHCRVTKIDVDRFNVDLTSRSSDLQDSKGEWAPQKDVYYDHDAADEAIKKEDSKKKANQSTYIKRVIVHPSFYNITFKQAEKLLVDMDQGEAIIRPSSKGSDHLTVTWKVEEGIYQHIDVREEGKENAFSLGQSLWINEEPFEDLDEIIARHIQPMASFARDVLMHKCFIAANGGKRDVLYKLLEKEKNKTPSRIPYFLSFSKEFPGKLALAYQPRLKPRMEYVSLMPDGYRYRQQIHSSLNALLRWFKEHFRDPIPGMNPTPRSHQRTPANEGTPAAFNLASVDTALLQKAVSSFPSGMFAMGVTPGATPRQTPRHTPRQTPRQTPQIRTGGSYGGFGGISQMNPYATPQLMTPSYQMTPRQGPGMTPRQTAGGMTPRQTAGGMTPRQTAGGMTPRHTAGGMTPRQGPGMTPRQGPGMTPRQGPGMTPRQGPGMTPRQGPGMTPRQGTGMTPRQTPRYQATPRQSWGSSSSQSGNRQSSRQTPRPSATPATDWAEAAAKWAKTRQNKANPSPRTQPSPAYVPSPMSLSTPAPGGDSTPLIDEH